MSKEELSKGQLSKGQLSKETLVQGDISPRRLLSKETLVQVRLWSKETIICILVQGFWPLDVEGHVCLAPAGGPMDRGGMSA